MTSTSSAAFIKPTTDPTSIGVGARPVGMGNAFVGLSDDINSIFINPAGLAGLKTWQVHSMTTNLINAIPYISLAGTYNTDYGTFGLGYIGANISGSFITGLSLVQDRDIIFPITTSEAIDYTSSVILLSYGSDVKRFVDWSWLDNVSIGATFKLFSQGLSGGGISDGTLTGYDMDFGMLYRPNKWMTVGWNQIDALPASMGGKLSDPSGERIHILPTITKLGVAVKVLGDNDALYQYPQPLVYLFDLDYMPTQSNYPVIYRTGVEWWPSTYLALRAGLDQDIVGSDTSTSYSIDTNLTFGAGIQYNGFKFDYAYHKYGTLSDNDTSYLSLSYAAPLEVAAPAAAPVNKDYLQLKSPNDKITTYDEAVNIKGSVFNLDQISSVTINGQPVDFLSGSFEATYPLALGKNKFVIKVLKNSQELASGVIRVLRLVSFKDVSEKYWAKEPIETLATMGIIGGYPDGTFRPDKSINRAELTTLLVKAKPSGTPEAVDTKFSDVKKKHWASYYINVGVDESMVTGYPDDTFKPSKSLNRAEGVTILSRFAGLQIPDTILEGPYTDVPGRHWAAKSITAARSAGMLIFLTDKPFQPNKDLSRAEAAEILSRTPFASGKINGLKDFESY